MVFRQKEYGRRLARAEKLLRRELAKTQPEYKSVQVSSIDLSDRWRVRIFIKGEREKLVDATGWYAKYIRSGNRHRKNRGRQRPLQLREHPLMCYRGNHNWPPVWVKIPTPAEMRDTVRGEIGTLTEAGVTRVEPCTKCYLMIEHEDELYMGTLLFDDVSLCRQISELLQNHVGKTIKQIGDLEVSFTL